MTVVTITASGPWTVPAGVTVLDEVKLLAPGGGGGRGAGTGGGGGSGERRVLTALAVTPGETLDAVIGAIGTGRIGTNGAGTAGGNVTFSRGAAVLALATGGGAGLQSADGAGGTGGSGGTGTNGNPGSGGSGGGSVDGGLSGYSFGGDAGDSTTPSNGTNGGAGVVQITYSVQTPLDSVNFALAVSSITFLHREITPIDSVTYSVGLASIDFRHSGVMSLEPVAYNLAVSDVIFGRATPLDPLAYALTISNISFSTSGGVVPLPPTNLVLPNRAGVRRSLPATWASLRFRNFDTVPTRTQKLEILRERVQEQIFPIEVTLEGIPTASMRLMRYRAIIPMEFDPDLSLGDADVAATASSVFTVKVNAVTVGTITFAAGSISGDAVFTNIVVPQGALVEIFAPASPDATLSGITLALAGIRT